MSLSQLRFADLTRRRSLVVTLGLLAVVLGVTLAVVGNPLISSVVGRWQVDRAFEELPIPETWKREDVRVEVLADGSVVLAAGYRVEAERLDAIRRFVSAATQEGWHLTGGSADFSTATLVRGDLSLGVGTVRPDLPNVRLQVARYR